MKVKDYAKLMGLHPDSVRRSIRNGDIPAEQYSREWHIDDEFAEAMIQRETRFAKVEESAYLIKKRLLVKRSNRIIGLEWAIRKAFEGFSEIQQRRIVEKMSFPEQEEEVLKMIFGEQGIASFIKQIERLNASIEEMETIIDEVEVKDPSDKLKNPFLPGGKHHERT